MRAVFCVLFVLPHLLTACNQKDQTSGVENGVTARQLKNRLDSRIPPPDAGEYKDVRDAKDWRNPYLVIRAEGVEVISRSIPVERQVMGCDELAKFLASLPVAAWPYGRVAAAQEIGIRRGDGKDDQPIAENKARAERVLASLDVKVDWWPS